MHVTAPAPSLERQGGHALLMTGISVALGFTLSILVSRALGPAGKGMLDVASATAGLFTLVLGASLNAALTHDIARQGRTPSGFNAQLALWGAGAAGLCAFALAAAPELAARFGLLPETDARFWIAFVAVSVGFGIWAAGLRGILIGRQAVITANRIDVGMKVALLVGYVAVAVFAANTPRAFALVGIGGAVALSLALWFAARGATVPAPGTWAALLAIALPVHGTNILHFINQRADIFFVQAFHGAAQVGLYALAVSLAQTLLLLSSALAQPLLPQVSAAASPIAAAETAAKLCRSYIALSLLAAATLAVVGPWLVPRVFGRDFSGSLPSLLTLLPGMIAFGLTNILISYFVGIGRSRINLWISLATLAVTLVGNAWLTRRHGAIGAAATSCAAYGLAGAASTWLFARHAGLGVHRVILPLAADWRAAFAVVAQFRL